MTTALWTWSELCAALQLPTRAGPDIHGISSDSRSLNPGDLFVALSDARDGHDFIAAAIAAGAAGLLVSRPDAYALPTLHVPDTLQALRELARAARSRASAKVIAITGSSGKTTLKGLLAKALGAHASEASYNNHIGVPLTLARMPRDAQHAVVEIGTNHAGEIGPLVQLARPQVAVLLNVLPAHIGNFASFEALRDEKLSIASGFDGQGTLVLAHTLRPHYGGTARVLTFGTEAAADISVRTTTKNDALQAEVVGFGERCSFAVPGGGEHRALSCAAACGVAAALGMPLQAFVARLAQAEVPVGRGNRTLVAGIEIIDDSYNANPVSVAFALKDLSHGRALQPTGRKIALLGDILELGEHEERLHAELAPACAGVDRVFCVGPRMRALFDRLPPAQRGEHLPTPEECTVERVAHWLKPGDSLLVKGSNLIFWKRDLVAKLIAHLGTR